MRPGGELLDSYRGGFLRADWERLNRIHADLEDAAVTLATFSLQEDEQVARSLEMAVDHIVWAMMYIRTIKEFGVIPDQAVPRMAKKEEE